jgi:PAS domain S-box-containing protein
LGKSSPTKKVSNHKLGLLFVFLMLFFLFCQNNSSSNEQHLSGLLKVDPMEKSYNIAPFMEILEDKTTKLTINDVSSPLISQNFHKKPDLDPNFGYTNSAYWGRFSISSNQECKRILEFDYALAENIQLFIPDNKGGFIRKESGFLVPFGQREEKYRHFIVKLPVNQAPKTFYIRVKSNSYALQLPLILWKTEAFNNRVKNDFFVFGSFFGIFIFLILYNLILCLILKDSTYFYFVMHIISVIMVYMTLFGLTEEYFWPDTGNFNPNLSYFLIFSANVFLLLFSSRFLETSKYFPRISKSINYLIITFGLLAFLSLLTGLKYPQIIPLSGLLTLVIITVMAFYTFFKGYKPARYFLLAWLIYISPFFVVILNGLNIVEGNFFLLYNLLLGSSIEVILISLALADRLNSLKNRIEKQNILLEEEIIYRIDTENRALENQEKFRKLVEDINVIVWNAYPEPLEFTFVSKEAEKILGYSVRDWLEIPNFWKNHIYIEDRENAGNFFAVLAKNPKDMEFEYRMTDFEGKLIWFRNIVRVILENGKAIELVGVMVDITSQKLAEAELKEINDELDNRVNLRTIELELINKKHIQKIEELKNAHIMLVQAEKMASLGVLTAGIAHEINNPINYINASIYGLNNITEDILCLIDKYEQINLENFHEKQIEIEGFRNQIDFNELKEGLKVLTGNIIIGINRTSEIVNGLNTFSRSDDTNKYPFDINNNIDLTLRLLQSQFSGLIKINRQYGDIPNIMCFSGKINQVFMNLLSNAIDSIKSKKQLTDGEEIVIRTSHADENHIRVEITDTGPGIPKDIQGRIFEPFFTTKTVGKGTGLGLAITSSIIKNHNGKIEIQSNPVKGCTFIILLPIKEEKFSTIDG